MIVKEKSYRILGQVNFIFQKIKLDLFQYVEYFFYGRYEFGIEKAYLKIKYVLFRNFIFCIVFIDSRNKNFNNSKKKSLKFYYINFKFFNSQNFVKKM